MASKEKGIRIAITGPECTGKTTLAQLLATHFNGLWVPEFSRSYLSSLGRKYTYEDLALMAKEQLNQEKKIWDEAKNKPVFSDTEMLVFYIWSMYRFDKCDQFIVQRIREADY
ncbi:MAG: ATP-binding protein, partial [Flavobacteriales bacterium]|nr:ATP-binding protein [Flavobacteriales bacterium]